MGHDPRIKRVLDIYPIYNRDKMFTPLTASYPIFIGNTSFILNLGPQNFRNEKVS